LKPIDKLIKLLESDNLADSLDEEQKIKIVQDVLIGVKIDDDSRSNWLETNKEAMRIIKHCEEQTEEDTLDTPIYKAAKVIYPLLAPAVIQLASRMIVHIVRNDRIFECAVLGKDSEVPEDPEAQQMYDQMMQQIQQNPEVAQQLQQSGQIPPPPKKIWKKKDRAKRVSDYSNYKLLIESDTWLKDKHKLCHIVASWGTGFTQVYYDPISKKNCFDLLSPEDVIINHNISCLEKATRVTVRHYMTKNEILEQIRSGAFSDIEEELLDRQPDNAGNNASETMPAAEVFCQYMYIDLDEDGYAEPYKVWVHKDLNLLLGIYPAFDMEDINVDEKGKIRRITRVLDIVDDHLIDDPEGKFYSIGLNYLLLHQNKSITSILRQVLDAGSLSNASSCTGFITNAFKPRERNIEFTLGQYNMIDVNPNVDPRQHVIPLPAKEPSQVLVGLLQMLISGGEKTGFITDVLTGDIAGQNVPATTMLAMVEQGTRAFKPIIEKFWISRKKEFKLDFKLNAKYLNEEEYIQFHDNVVRVSKEDFNTQDIDICPVADPTQSSESHKYAKMQFILQLLATQALPAMNVQENLLELYKGMEYDNPDRFIAQPQPPAPDPKMEQVKVNAQKVQAESERKAQKLQLDFQNHQSKIQIEAMALQNERLKTQIKVLEAQQKGGYNQALSDKLKTDQKVATTALLQKQQEINIKKQEADTKQEAVDVQRLLAQRQPKDSK
jgi:chaperonin GroES